MHNNVIKIPFERSLRFAHDFLFPSNQKLAPAHPFHPNNPALTLPHASLLTQNRFIGSYSKDATVWLVHSTRNFRQLQKSKTLLPSPGCLISAVYCVQGYKKRDPSVLLHNYGKHVFHHLGESGKKILKPLVIGMKLPPAHSRAIVGVNYLKMGPYYFELMHSFSKLMSRSQWDSIQLAADNAIASSKGFIVRVRHHYEAGNAIRTIEQALKWCDLISDMAKRYELFSFVYFEAMAQCIMLSSLDPTTQQLAQDGECNNLLYIKCKYEAIKKLSSRFVAIQFQPSGIVLKQSLEVLKQTGIIDLDVDKLIINITRKFIYDIYSYFCASEWNDGRFGNAALRGQKYYLQLFKLKDAETLREHINTITSRVIWNFWNTNNVMLPINSTTLKGEIGINPAFPNLAYTVFAGRYSKYKESVIIEEKTNIRLSCFPV